MKELTDEINHGNIARKRFDNFNDGIAFLKKYNLVK